MINTDGYNNIDHYEQDGYMEQEEEWEREGLLDPAWEKQQKKVSDRRFRPRGNLKLPLADPDKALFACLSRTPTEGVNNTTHKSDA